jgi:hypothetical protein
VRLGAPLRGVIYGFALIVAVPVAGSSGRSAVAVFLVLGVLVGMGIEARMMLGRRS